MFLRSSIFDVQCQSQIIKIIKQQNLMGCSQSAAEQTITFKLINDYRKYLQLTNKSQNSTNSLIFHAAQKIITTFANDIQIQKHDSPYCILEITFSFMEENHKSWCTCTLITPILALTSANMVYAIKNKQFAQCTVKTYGKNSKSSNVTKVFVPQQFIDGNLNEDYALLVLEQPFSQTGFFGLSYINKEIDIQNFFINIIGTVDAKQIGSLIVYSMKGYKGLFNQIDNQQYLGFHQLTTADGLKGGGIFIMENKLPYLIGIQCRRDEVLNKSTVLLFNEKRFKNIKEWTKDVMDIDFQREVMSKLNFRAIQIQMI